MKLFHAESSPPCRTVVLLGNCLNLQFELIPTIPRNGDTAKPEFKKINPQHVVPTLIDDNGFILWERAICKYLVKKYGKDDKLYPDEFMKRINVDKYLDFDLGTLYRRAVDYFLPVLMTGKFDQARVPKLADSLQVLDTFLKRSSSGWIAGDNMTIADISLLPTIVSLEVAGFDLIEYKEINKWMVKVKSAIPNYHIEGENGALAFKEMLEKAQNK